MTEVLYCESCGESEQEIHLQEAGLCGDCYARTMTEVIQDATGDHLCCHPLFVDGKLAAICAIPFGVEHAHGTIQCLEVTQ